MKKGPNSNQNFMFFIHNIHKMNILKEAKAIYLPSMPSGGNHNRAQP